MPEINKNPQTKPPPQNSFGYIPAICQLWGHRLAGNSTRVCGTTTGGSSRYLHTVSLYEANIAALPQSKIPYCFSGGRILTPETHYTTFQYDMNSSKTQS